MDHTAMLGGGEIALLNLIRRLDRNRYVPIVALFSDGPLGQRLAAAGIETHVLPLDRSVLDARKESLGVGMCRPTIIKTSLHLVSRLKELIRQQRIDLVHTNSLKSDIIGGLAARWAGTPIVWHVRDQITDDYLPPMVVRAFRLLARLIPTHVVGNSNATIRTLRILNPERRTTIYSGIDCQAPRHAPDTSNCHRVLRIGLIGRISPWKGQHIFLHAAAKVLLRFPEATFMVVGAPLFAELEYERRTKALAHELDIATSIEFTGFRDDVPAIIASLGLLVHASTTGEPFGQVIVEGMAAAKPVVATDGGGVPEIVVHGQTGLLVPMRDPDALASAICRVLENPTWARQMGELGRQRALRMFTVERSAVELQGLYDRLLKEKPSVSSIAQR